MGGFTDIGYSVPGQATAPRLLGEEASMDWVSNDYFRVVGIPLLAGRGFAGDNHEGVVVNEIMARTTWPGENPLTKCLVFGRRCTPVIGVVGDVHRKTMIESPWMRFYLPNPGGPRVLLLRVPDRRSIDRVRQLATAAMMTIPGVRGATATTLSEFLDPEYRPWRLARQFVRRCRSPRLARRGDRGLQRGLVHDQPAHP